MEQIGPGLLWKDILDYEGYAIDLRIRIVLNITSGYSLLCYFTGLCPQSVYTYPAIDARVLG